MATLNWATGVTDDIANAADWGGTLPGNGDIGVIGVGVPYITALDATYLPNTLTLQFNAAVGSLYALPTSLLGLIGATLPTGLVIDDTETTVTPPAAGSFYAAGLVALGAVQSGAIINVGSQDLLDIGVASYGGAIGSFDNTGVINVSGVGANQGLLSFRSLDGVAGETISYGTINLVAGDLVTTVADATGSNGQINLSGGSQLWAIAALTSTNVTFQDGASNILDLGPQGAGSAYQFGGTISGFQAGDAIALEQTATSQPLGNLNFDYSTGILTLIDGSTLHFAGDFSGETFSSTTVTPSHLPDGSYSSEVEIQVSCFVTGTQVTTPQGEVAVETLRAGDLVITAAGAVAPVRWMGRRAIASRFGDPLRVMPVRVRAGALGEGAPKRDLLLSSDHALLVGGVLVQAGALINGVSIVRETTMPDVFTYWHVELADHALILAEGAPAETFIDNVDRMGFDNWAEHEALGDVPPIGEMPYPRAKSARQLPQVIRARLLEIADAGLAGAA